jgi:hypothetical protein
VREDDEEDLGCHAVPPLARSKLHRSDVNNGGLDFSSDSEPPAPGPVQNSPPKRGLMDASELVNLASSGFDAGCTNSGQLSESTATYFTGFNTDDLGC